MGQSVMQGPVGVPMRGGPTTTVNDAVMWGYRIHG